MNVDEAVGYLRENGYGSCISWEIDPRNNLVFGFTFGGKLDSRYSHFEAIAIAEKLQQESLRAAYRDRAGNSPTSSDGLGSLEWRKQVDKQLESVEFTRQCHNDRFHRDEKQLQDHDYRITAWGECVSDALKSIVATIERIAKLEAKLAEFENIATVEEVGEETDLLGRRVTKLEAKITNLLAFQF